MPRKYGGGRGGFHSVQPQPVPVLYHNAQVLGQMRIQCGSYHTYHPLQAQGGPLQPKTSTVPCLCNLANNKVNGIELTGMWEERARHCTLNPTLTPLPLSCPSHHPAWPVPCLLAEHADSLLLTCSHALNRCPAASNPLLLHDHHHHHQ
jgi:hypothetical protein